MRITSDLIDDSVIITGTRRNLGSAIPVLRPWDPEEAEAEARFFLSNFLPEVEVLGDWHDDVAMARAGRI